MNRFQKSLRRQNDGRPPVWFMRQAGRYHAHYQKIRKEHSFLEVCRSPKIARDVAMGPMDDFGFDAAILFSDILFPLAAMGIDLDFAPGPVLGRYLRSVDDLQFYEGGAARADAMQFQQDALALLKKTLSPEKGLIGFVGGLSTLYVFAVEGSHKKSLDSAMAGLKDGRFFGLMEKLLPIMRENMKLQAVANPDCIAVLDTCAGDLPDDFYKDKYLPLLTILLRQFKADYPDMNIVYYGKNIGPAQWDLLTDLPIDGIGIDWKHDLADVLVRYHDRFAVQGNIDPTWMELPTDQMVAKVRPIFEKVLSLPPAMRRGWICGLGHGITPQAREENVHAFLRLQKEMFDDARQAA